jgi:hypothetical protein
MGANKKSAANRSAATDSASPRARCVGQAGAATYRITVCGHLDDHWSDWLQDVDVCRRDDGTTDLRVDVADQSALYGLLVRLRDLGLALAAVQRLDDEPDPHGPAELGTEGRPLA